MWEVMLNEKIGYHQSDFFITLSKSDDDWSNRLINVMSDLSDCLHRTQKYPDKATVQSKRLGMIAC